MAWIERAAHEDDQPLPPKLQKLHERRPELDESELFHWTAFSYLSSCREVGMAVGEIPWTAVDRYAERFELEPDVRDLFEYLMHRMDAAYMADQRTKEEARRAEMAAANPPGGGPNR